MEQAEHNKSQKQCVVCNSKKSPYRCPRCRAFYCSKDCCARHKDQLFCNPNSDNVTSSSSSSQKKDQEDQTQAVETDEQIKMLTEEQKTSLRNDKKLKSLLQSNKLKRHIVAIDSAPDRPAALKKMRLNNPHFESVVDVILNALSSVT